MTESDSREAATTESPNLISKASDFLKSKTSKEVATAISPLFKSKETTEYKSALALFECCLANFSDFLIIKLLNVYSRTKNGILRFRTIYLLSESIVVLRNRSFKLSLAALGNVKPVLVSCFKNQKTKVSDFKILRRIVSFVAHNVAALDDGDEGGRWDELRDCIVELANRDPIKALLLFLDLPLSYGRFLCSVLQTVFEKAEDLLLLSAEKGRAQDWILGLETVFKIGIMLHSDSRDVVESLVVKSASEVVKKGNEEVLEKGLEDLKKFLARDGSLCKYDEDQRVFVGWLAFQVAACYRTIEESKEASKEVLRVVRKPERYRNGRGSGFDSDWFDHLMNLSSLQVLRIFVMTDLGDRSRELAIRSLKALLSDIKPNVKVSDHISMMRQLQPLLITCLKEDGLSESMFKVLGEVVNQVACDILIYEGKTWGGLRDFIVSRSKTEFERAVYIFQCLTVPLNNDEFVVPVMDNLIAEIRSRLSPPRERLVDNSCWVLAFAGAFCGVVRLIDIETHAEPVKEIAHMMIDSVRELVERGMEVGLVRRALRDVESIVKKQVEWYGTSEYKLVKCLLWRLYAIENMRMESRMVLWRINVRVERAVGVEVKELPENDELDWINQPELPENDELDWINQPED